MFEGAQGLLLDQDRGHFPHVTRSNTGLHNVLILAEELHVGRLDVTYTTRCYLTRHGAGPMRHETSDPPYPGIIDQINIPNPYQGAMRFGLLDLDMLARSSAVDRGNAAPSSIEVVPSLAVTCLAQQGDAPARFIQQGMDQMTTAEELLERVTAMTRAATLYTAAGPTRQAVRQHRSQRGRAVA